MSTAKELQAMVIRAKAQANAVKGQATMLAREAITTCEIAAASFGCGFANEKLGQVDLETGQKIHMLNGVPSALVAGAALKVAAGLDVFGEYSRDAFAVGSGAIASWSNDAGRGAAIRLAKKNASKTVVTVETKQEQAVAA